MKWGIIDIGSNSVRLLVVDGAKTLLKTNKITRLSENMGDELTLKTEMVDRTVCAVSFFVNTAKKMGVENIKIFATAAVRKAKNKQFFIDKIKSETGYDLDVVSGELEAKLGVLGALKNDDGAVIDIGGASTEIAIKTNGEISYLKSIDIGAVNTTEKGSNLLEKTLEFISEKINDFGDIKLSNLVGIGGTITSLASISLKLEVYDAEKVNGYALSYSEIERLNNMLFNMSIEERESLIGLQKERANIIASGSAILLCVMKKFNVKNITISESDNLEGYSIYKGIL